MKGWLGDGIPNNSSLSMTVGREERGLVLGRSKARFKTSARPPPGWDCDDTRRKIGERWLTVFDLVDRRSASDRRRLQFYTVTQKKRNRFSFLCIFFGTWRKLANFFTYIRPRESRSISYNSVHFISAWAENFAATVTLNILYLPVK